MRVRKDDYNLAVERPVQRPNYEIRQQHQKADNEAAHDKDVAKDQWKYVAFHPVPHDTHC